MTNQQQQTKHFTASFITPNTNRKTKKMADKEELRENNSGKPALGSARAVKQYNRQKRDELITNYQRLFTEFNNLTNQFEDDVVDRACLNRNLASTSILSHEQTVRQLWMNPKTRIVSVKPFVRIPCPDLLDCADQLQRQHGSALLFGGAVITQQTTNTIELSEQQPKLAKQLMTSIHSIGPESGKQIIYHQQMSAYWNANEFSQKKVSSNNFQRRVIFDLDDKSMEQTNFILDNDHQQIRKLVIDPFLTKNNNVHRHLCFESRFESGNLWKAIQIDPTEYELILSADINAPFSNPHFQWFYFAVSGMQNSIPYTFEVINCVKSVSMFSQGMQPVLFSVSDAVHHGRPGWRRAGTEISYFRNLYAMPNRSFEMTDSNSGNVALKKNNKNCNSKCKKMAKQNRNDGSDMEIIDTPRRCTRSATAAAKALNNSSNSLQSPVTNSDDGTPNEKDQSDESNSNFYSLRFTVQFPHDDDICYIAYHFPYTYTRLQSTLERWLISTTNLRKEAANGIYFQRQELCRTLMGNSVPFLTITSCLNSVTLPMINLKQLVLITARVHPGETNSSWIMHGIIQFLLSAHPIACRARELFVFKLIPMLNPDGVINGSHRCSLFGQDLNRVWNDPSPLLHPTIFHTKGLIQYAVDILDRPPFVFIDLHGHSRKPNIFMYGNNPKESWRKSDQRKQKQTKKQQNASEQDDNDDAVVDDMHANVKCASQEHLNINKQKKHRQQHFSLLPEILDKISDSFALKDCVFSITKSKEYSARIATWRQFRLNHVYTMESTYFGFDNGPKAGTQITITDMKRMGTELVEALVCMHDIVNGTKVPVQQHQNTDKTQFEK